jgi:hypothetical protein
VAAPVSLTDHPVLRDACDTVGIDFDEYNSIDDMPSMFFYSGTFSTAGDYTVRLAVSCSPALLLPLTALIHVVPDD